MSMTTCDECNREISTLADRCAGCGAPIHLDSTWDRWERWITKPQTPGPRARGPGLLGIVGAGILLWAMFGSPKPVSQTAARSGPVTDGELVQQTIAERSKWTTALRDRGLNCDWLKETKYRGEGAYGSQYFLTCSNGAEFYLTKRPNGEWNASPRSILDSFKESFESGLKKGMAGSK